MPTEILTDPRMARCAALVLGEGETRVAELLADHRVRANLPGVMWLDPILKTPVTGGTPGHSHHLAPDIDALPFVDRRFLVQDPHFEAGRWEANMVGARGCPYNCRTEADLYGDATARLAKRGYPLLMIDTTNTPTTQVTAMIAGRIAQLADVPQAGTTTA